MTENDWRRTDQTVRRLYKERRTPVGRQCTMRSSIAFALLAALVAVAFANPAKNPAEEAVGSLVDARRALRMSLNSLTQLETVDPEIQKQIKLLSQTAQLVATAVQQKSEQPLFQPGPYGHRQGGRRGHYKQPSPGFIRRYDYDEPSKFKWSF
uniref:DUF148 domain-containing protein n=1 Tax=Steinernema glaseri TaxID=37863 RepID=A0A1I7Z1W3_9BILA